MKRLLLIVAIVLIIAAGAWYGLRGPDPATILARIEVPPSPVLNPEEEATTFELAPNFRIELVAAEPLIVDPVAMDWDEQGRLYVVEMRGFMPDIEGRGEDAPVGRVVRLEDLDGDGRMDVSQPILEGLVLPRAVVVLPEGLLIGAPPHLLICPFVASEPDCSSPRRLGDYASEPGNVEHRENALLPGLDGWIYNSKSARRFRFVEGRFEIDTTAFRGQWGLAQDDSGRLYSNHNSGFLYVDLFPADALFRQPATAARLEKQGLNVDLAAGEEVFGIRVAPGLNRAYQRGSLRADGRQKAPTGVSGLVIQRGDQFGQDYVGDAFIPESAGAAVAHFALEDDGLSITASHRLYADPVHGHREFLASTDERFRPVDAKVGPDGALWVIDMYRGVIQHAEFVSEYLREYVADHGLAPPGSTGRIWRVVRSDREIDYRPPALETVADLLAALDHPNGWVRDRAQRQILARSSEAISAAVRQHLPSTPLGRAHQLRTLAQMGALDEGAWREAVHDADPAIRSIAFEVAGAVAPEAAGTIADAAQEALSDTDRRVRLSAILSFGALPPEARPLDAMLEVGRTGDPIEQQAVLSGLDQLEQDALDAELARGEAADSEWVRALGLVVFAGAQRSADPLTAVTILLDRIEDTPDDDLATALLTGIADARALPDQQRMVLDGPHPLFSRTASESMMEALAEARIGFTWPGDPRPGGARALTPIEEDRRSRGAALFAGTCATCHGLHGRGNAGLAPPLVGSPWVRDADEWLVRIIVDGLYGPIRVAGTDWDRSMPGHGLDPRFDDEGVASLVTYLRRAWGHADDPISLERVAEIRRAVADREGAWTVPELLALPVEHRLDRFTGIYRVPIVGIEMAIRREGAALTMGRRSGGTTPLLELSDARFSGSGIRIHFNVPSDGSRIESAEAQAGANAFTLTRVED